MERKERQYLGDIEKKTGMRGNTEVGEIIKKQKEEEEKKMQGIEKRENEKMK